MASKVEKKSGSGGRKNPVLIPGIHRFGRSKMYHKKGIFIKRTLKAAPKAAVKKPLYIEKPIAGDKNGLKRLVQLKKSKRYHPTATTKVGRPNTNTGVVRRTKLRGSLKPGTILILLAGRHAGKRVILLKQLNSGLLLVTGPFKLNGVPLRRVNQQYVIATSTRLDISKLNVPETLTDTYFRRDKKATLKQRQKQQGNIYAADRDGYTLSDTRKKDQELVDKQIMGIVKDFGDKGKPEKKLLLQYLATSFSLKSGQYPHKMRF